MAIIKGDRIRIFKLFGFTFLIYKKAKPAKRMNGGGLVSNSVKLIRRDKHIVLAMPDGTVIPHQLDLEIKAPLNDVTTATVELFVTLD
jgi:hypothetical protein